MSQHTSHYSKSQSKNPIPTLTKNTIITWITSLLKDYSQKIMIQLLGDGEIYCRIINHYVPNIILPNRIIFNPKNEYEYCLNLKQFQNALCKLKISINFDIHKVSKQKFNQNWTLITNLYKHLEIQDNKKSEGDSKRQIAQENMIPNKSIQGSQKINDLPLVEEKIENKKNGVVYIDNFPKGSLLSAVDHVKEILLSNTHDTEKIRRIKLLFGLEPEIKFEDNEANYNNTIRIFD